MHLFSAISNAATPSPLVLLQEAEEVAAASSVVQPLSHPACIQGGSYSSTLLDSI